jgi:UDP-N-acetylmuramate: L-alanyl-gamma-D-glutamyl-meso-diaminopimelate ligase
MKKHLHFIAIGGAAMHNLALALHQNGYIISGSDDEILEPSRTRLEQAGLLPESEGWFPEKISKGLDGIVLGMHARIDNPELLRAKELGIPVFSFPEFLYEHSKNKLRIVIGGSHGKTTITAMILHVLQKLKYDFDYMVGAKLDGFDTMVRLSNAPLIILEGDEYLSSPIDRRPKFHLYHADIGLISGIAWDHINVFPTFDIYKEQFKIFADGIPENGTLVYCSDDPELNTMALASDTKGLKIPYNIIPHKIENGETILLTDQGEIPVSVFGNHNLMNLEGARLVCERIGVKKELFYREIGSFRGASRRLELLAKNNSTAVYRDFAHSPSKLKATVQAVRQQYPLHQLIACMELHTFSSLNKEFLNQYAGTMDDADVPIVFFNPHTLEHKKLEPLPEEKVCEAFKNSRIRVFTDSLKLESYLLSMNASKSIFLLMSSGTFNNINISELAGKLSGGKSVLKSI